MEWSGVAGTELMPSLFVGYTERCHRKLKSCNSFLKPEFELGPSFTPHAAVSNRFNLGRHKVGAQHYRDLRISAFEEWSRAAA
jgi:hypothetical protein